MSSKVKITKMLVASTLHVALYPVDLCTKLNNYDGIVCFAKSDYGAFLMVPMKPDAQPSHLICMHCNSGLYEFDNKLSDLTLATDHCGDVEHDFICPKRTGKQPHVNNPPPSEISGILRYARSLDCDWIMLDSYGPLIKELPIYHQTTLCSVTELQLDDLY